MSGECDKCGEHCLDCKCTERKIVFAKRQMLFQSEVECGCLCNKSGFGRDYWFKFRDNIYEIGKPSFSIVSNGEDEHPDPNVVRISDCKFNVFIDVSCNGDYQDALERANALCQVLNADYPFWN